MVQTITMDCLLYQCRVNDKWFKVGRTRGVLGQTFFTSTLCIYICLGAGHSKMGMNYRFAFTGVNLSCSDYIGFYR